MLLIAFILDREVPKLRVVGICCLFLVGAYITVLGETNFELLPFSLIVLNNLFAIFHGRSVTAMKEYNKAPLGNIKVFFFRSLS